MINVTYFNVGNPLRYALVAITERVGKPAVNARQGATGRKREKICQRTGGKRGKNVCPVSHDGKDNLRYLWNFVGKNVEPGILPGNVRATITINLCGR